jgi:hypothetical protein
MKDLAQTARWQHGPASRHEPAFTSGHDGRPARQARSARHERRLIVLDVELDALARLVGDRRFQRNVITGIIGLVALARLVREGETSSFARLVAWDEKQSLRRQRHPARNTRPIHGR